MMKTRSLSQQGILCFIVALAILPILAIHAQDQSSQPVKREGLTIQLISDKSVIKAGEPFRVGLHIRHDKGYHTYWKQPGVVGMATSFDWDLPEGFSVSEISWPYPELSDMAGHPCHGYERDVTLFVTITPPKVLPKPEQTIRVEAAWMCCAANCFPGFQELKLTLPVGDKSQVNPKHSALIDKARKEVPAASKSWQTKLLSYPDGKIMVLEILTKEKSRKAENVYLFSSDGQVSSDKKQVLKKLAAGQWSLTLTRSDVSPKGSKSLPAVLHIDGENLLIEPRYLSEK